MRQSKQTEVEVDCALVRSGTQKRIQKGRRLRNVLWLPAADYRGSNGLA